MYILYKGDRIHFNHGGYVWHGFVVDQLTSDQQITQYRAVLKPQEVNDYNWYMKTGTDSNIVLVELDQLIM